MNRLLLMLVCIFGMCQAAHAKDWQLSADVDFVSEYNFRGVTLAGNAVQTGLQASYKNVFIGAWGSVPVADNSEVFPEEVNLYGGFTYDVSEAVTTELGVTVYHYPQSGNLSDFASDGASTVEVYGSINFDTFLSPELTAYYDVQLETVTLEGQLSYGVEISDVIELGAEASTGFIDTDLGQSYTYGSLNAGLYIRPLDFFEWRVLANFGASSEQTFLDTDFDLSDPSTFKAPEKQGAWVSTGISVSY